VLDLVVYTYIVKILQL